jgi:hypothetical protein
MFLLLAVLLASSPAAQSLEDEGSALLSAKKFDLALSAFEAANRLESTPARLLAIARCHREIAYVRVREAEQLQQTEQVMRELKRSLEDHDASREEAPPEHIEIAPPVAPPAQLSATPAPLAAAPLPEQQTTIVLNRRTAAIAGIGAGVALLVGSGLAHLHASDMISRVNDPAQLLSGGDREDLAQSARNWQVGSNVLLGAGLLLAASGFLAWRF